MLVLSRRHDQRIVIPVINTAIQIVSVKPGVVRLGIDAPDDISIFRAEVLEQPEVRERVARECEEVRGRLFESREARHDLRNRLNAAAVGLALLRRQLDVGMTTASADTLERVEREFAQMTEALEARSRPAAPAPAARARALVVEDDSNERELLAGFLRMAGYDVHTAADGQEAVHRLAEPGKTDVVLLDMILPRQDGPATIRAIREHAHWDTVKIVAMTGHDIARFGGDPAARLVDRWFRKPLNPQSLLSDLNLVLAG